MDIPFIGDKETEVEQLAIPPLWELVMIRSSHDTTMAGSSSVSWWVNELRHQLESAHCESQDRVTEAMGAWVAELHAIKQATAAELELDAMKVHLAETKVEL